VRIRRKTRITVETERILIIRRRGIEMQGWCEGCGEQVKLVTPQTASSVTGLSVRAICQLVEAGELNFLETNDGLLLICLNSLAQETGRVYYGTDTRTVVSECWQSVQNAKEI
jgi:hypothetical protein